MPLLRRLRPRIPQFPWTRPPDRPCHLRFFAGNRKLLLLSPATPRPQLSFLNPSRSQSLPKPLAILHSRLFTSKTKRFLKEQWGIGWRWFIFWSALTAFIIGEGLVIVHELLERDYPTPHEWRLFNRARFHSAKAFEHPETTPLKVPFWEGVGASWKCLLRHLEDPKDEGEGLREQEDGGILIPGAGKAGYDITEKPEPWRRGYWEALMGCAAAAEHLEDRVRDKTRGVVFPIEYMIGPSNPNPKPCPKYMKHAPKEEDCEPAFDRPETYYIKLLTTKGFTTKQRLTAAIAYGEYLDGKGQHGAAEEMFRWGLDIAQSPLAAPSEVIDSQTAIIHPNAPIITSNVLAAANALAVHHAQTGQPAAALPIFVSILRARRSSPAGPPPGPAKEPRRIDVSNQTDIGAFFTYCRALIHVFTPVEFPPAPPTGDEPFERTAAADCDEAPLMTYLGELLFATSRKERAAALGWTRDALLLADERAHDVRLDADCRRKCIECIGVALENWRDMVARLREEEAAAGTGPARRGSWGAWFGLGGVADSKKAGDSRAWLDAEEDELRWWEEKVSRDGLKERVQNRGKPVWAFPQSHRLLSVLID